MGPKHEGRVSKDSKCALRGIWSHVSLGPILAAHPGDIAGSVGSQALKGNFEKFKEGVAKHGFPIPEMQGMDQELYLPKFKVVLVTWVYVFVKPP